MNKYDFMQIEEWADTMGSLYIENEIQEILPILNDMIDTCLQLKGEIMKGSHVS